MSLLDGPQRCISNENFQEFWGWLQMQTFYIWKGCYFATPVPKLGLSTYHIPLQCYLNILHLSAISQKQAFLVLCMHPEALSQYILLQETYTNIHRYMDSKTISIILPPYTATTWCKQDVIEVLTLWLKYIVNWWDLTRILHSLFIKHNYFLHITSIFTGLKVIGQLTHKQLHHQVWPVSSLLHDKLRLKEMSGVDS